MKNKTIKNLFLLLLFTLVSLGNTSPEQKSEVSKKIYKTELFLKDAIRKDLDQLLTDTKLIIKVNLDVDRNKVLDDVGELNSKWSEIRSMQLPGLFLDEEIQGDLKEVKEVSMENILSHISVINIDIVSSEKNLDVSTLDSTVRKIVKSNYNRFEEIDLKLNISFDEKLMQDQSKSNVDSSLLTDEFKNNGMDFVRDNLLYIVSVVGFFLLALFVYFIRDLSGSVKSVRDTIEKKDLSPASKLDNSSELKDRQRDSDDQVAKEQKSTGEYNNIVEGMRSMLSDYSEIFSEMISFNMNTENFVDLAILMEVIPKKTRASVYKQLPDEKVSRFRKFLLERGERLYASGKELEMHAEKMMNLLKLSYIDPDQFYSYYFKTIVNRLDTKDFQKVINQSSSNELMFLTEYAQTNKVAFAMMNSNFDKESLTCDYRDLSQQEVKLYLEKISNICFVSEENHYSDVREKLMPYLSSELEEVVLGKLQLNVRDSFSTLVETNFDYVCQFMQSLVYVDKRELIAVFDPTLRDKILKSLPEIVSERLAGEKIEMTESSLYLKSVLYKDLASLESESSQNSKIEDKYAA